MPSALVEEVLGRIEDGWSLDDVECFIDRLRLDEERASALWLVAWLDCPSAFGPRLACTQPA
jgi:hypothetical protein